MDFEYCAAMRLVRELLLCRIYYTLSTGMPKCWVCMDKWLGTVIDALYYLTDLIGHPLEDKIVDYIDAKSDCGEISANFNIFTEDVIYEVSYTIVLQKSEKYAMIVGKPYSCAINQGNSRKNGIHGL